MTNSVVLCSIYVVNFFLTDESFTLENLRHTLRNEKKLLSLLHAHHEEGLEDCVKLHSCLSWSVVASILLRAKEKIGANYILQDHELLVKGYS